MSKFKVGDTVKAISNEVDGGVVIGRTYTVFKVVDDLIHVKDEDGNLYCQFDHRWEKANYQFKAGDRVVGVDFGDGGLAKYQGETGTVTKYANGWVYVKWDHPRGDRLEGGWLPSRFKLIPKAEANKPKFKVGDRVRFTDKTNSHWWFGPNTEYKTGVITQNDRAGFYNYVVQTEKPWPEAFVSEAMIELVTEEVKTVEVLAKPRGSRFIVAVEENGGFAPSSEPKEYSSLRQAETVAKKMAEKHGKTFYILQAVAAAVPPLAPKAELVKL
jgi:hypothetical protein